MSYWDKWYSWLLTPVSHAIRNAGQGLYNGTKDILSNDNNGQPWDLGFNDDDWNRLLEPYSAQIEALRGNGYGDLVDAALAQWKGTLTSYKPGVMDRLAGVVDGRSGRDKYFENVAAQLGEALNGISQQRQMNEYDSPIQQAARERMAGINPDLLGTGDVAGAAAPAEDTNNVLPDTATFGLDAINTFASNFMSAFQFASGIVGFVQDTKAKSLNLNMLRTQTESSYVDFADKFIIGALPEEFTSAADLAKVMSDKWSAYKEQYGSVFRPKQWHHLDKIISDRYSGLPTSAESFKLYKQRASDRADYVMQRESQYYSLDFDDLQECLQPLVDASDKIRALQLSATGSELEAKKAQAGYESEYYDSLDGSTLGANQMSTSVSNTAAAKSAASAAASNATSAYNQAVASQYAPATAASELGITQNQERLSEINATVENAKKRVIKKLEEKAKKGNVFAKALLFHYSLVSIGAETLGSVIGVGSNAAAAAAKVAK